ncbi:PepSY domain-containing protein [Prescottella defluvii]|uniref:PepSY domain-containing protein n=1 Tax=Prescottella defluvii TaxID=1323361 RepID=UPI0004F2E5EC|nr:PepSY domain-containing protein [Prescottella defluvii]
MRIFRNSVTSRVGTAAVAGFAVVALVGCSSDDSSSSAATTTSAAAATTSTSKASGAPGSAGAEAAASTATSPAGATGAAGATQTRAPGWNAKVFEHAGRTAVAAVPGSSLISIEENIDGSWEVRVANADGTIIIVGLSPDGDSVIAGPSPAGERNTSSQEANLDYSAATGIVLGEVPGGRIVDLELVVEKGGTYVWEADVIDASGAQRAVDVDAVSGRVLQNAPR